MRSTGIFILSFFLLVIGCSARSTDRTDIAKKHVATMLEAVETKNKTTLMSLFNTTSDDLQSIDEFVKELERIRFYARRAEENSDGSIDARVQLYGIPGTTVLKKCPKSVSGWQVIRMSFTKYLGPNVRSAHPVLRKCFDGFFQCVIDVINNWRDADRDEKEL